MFCTYISSNNDENVELLVMSSSKEMCQTHAEHYFKKHNIIGTPILVME